jgi:hypothetical protein
MKPEVRCVEIVTSLTIDDIEAPFDGFDIVDKDCSKSVSVDTDSAQVGVMPKSKAARASMKTIWRVDSKTSVP